MKKILFAMAALLGCATVGFAQNNYVATLQHEGAFTHYYGSGALTSAYNAAAEGDTITLSPGTFSSPGTINKGITLRGTGISAAAKSYVSGNVTFCSTDSTRVTIVEGVRFSNSCYIQNNASGGERGQGKIKLIKDFIDNGIYFNTASNYSTVKGPEVRIYNNIIWNRFAFYANSYPDVFVYNSDVSDTYSDTGFAQTTSAYINCIIYYGYYYTYYTTTNQNFYNCIFVFPSSNSYQLSSSNTCRNCLSVNNTQLFANQMYGGNNWTNANRSEVFSTGYVLTDEAKEKYIGTDGTEIGYYGGSYPYNTKVQYPIVTNFSSDVQTSKEGILNINVEVDGQ